MKVFLNKIKESWIIDRVRKDWYKNNKDISTNYIYKSNIFWIISPWTWNSIPRRALEGKKFFARIIILILIILMKKFL